jgi:hypothetical protein
VEATSGFFISALGVHTAGSNYICADGHAKWMRASAVSAGGNNNAAWGIPCGINDDGVFTDHGGMAALQADLSTCHVALSFGVN